jgi:small-conductance mechanosensitive channel
MTGKIDRFFDWLLLNLDALILGSAVALALVALMMLLRALGHAILRKDPRCASWRGVIGRVLSKTSILFMVAAALEIVVNYAQPPARIERLFDIAFTIASSLQAAVWGRELILGVIGQQVGERPGETALGNAMGVIRVLVSVALFGIALVVILDNLGVNVTALVAGLGIGGIAIGLAAKGIFDDLFSALSIIFDKPFQRGDQIRWDKTTGTVEEIGLKTTRVRATTGEEVVISNTNLLNKELHNMQRLNRRRVEFTLHIAYNTPPRVLHGIQDIIKGAVEGRDKCKLVRCGISDLTLPTIEIQVQFDVLSQSWDKVFQARHEIAIALLDAFEDAKIEFAGPDGKSITPPVNSPPPGTAGAQTEEDSEKQ